MGARDSSYAEALAAACAAVRDNPKLAHWAAFGEHPSKVAAFERTRPVQVWLNSSAYGRAPELLIGLLAKAQEFVNEGGQGDLLVAAYAGQRDSGRLHDLRPTRFAVHRAVFSLALMQGAPLLASTRYLATAVRAQSGIAVAPAVVRTHLLKLVRDRLIQSYEPGRPGIRANSGVVRLDLPTTPPDCVDLDALVALSLTSRQLMALRDYRIAAKKNLAKRSEAAHRPHAEAHAERANQEEAERQAAEELAEQQLRQLIDSGDFLRGIDL